MTKMVPLPACAVPWTPRAYQLESTKFLLEHACAGLLLDPGLGKTSSTLAALTYLRKRGIIGKTLIIAPLRVCYNVWPNEIKKWKDFEHLKIEILHGKDKEAALTRDADIYVVNPEGLDWLLGVKREKYTVTVRDRRTGEMTSKTKTRVVPDMKRFEKFGFDVLVIDELSKFKHHDTSRFKALKPLLGSFSRRWGLTGSPASNGLEDLFGQAYVLDLGNALGRYITHYRMTYFYPDPGGYDWILKPGSEELIYEKLSPLCLRKGVELLDMPDLIQTNIEVTLPEATMRLYRSVEKDFCAAVNRRTVTAASAAAASSKLRQIANGGVFIDKEILANGLQAPHAAREWVNLHDEKTQALADLIEELQGQPLLIAYDFEHDLDRLRTAFKDGVFACDYSMKKFSEVVDEWNKGKIGQLFAHPQSLGHGLNMQGNAQHVAWHSMTWNKELLDQFNARIWRQGNHHKKVFVYNFISKDTIDEVIYAAQLYKGSVQNAFFEGIKKYAKERG